MRRIETCWPDGVLCARPQLRDLALELCRRQAADELPVAARVPGALGPGPVDAGSGAGSWAVPGAALDLDEDPDTDPDGADAEPGPSGGGGARIGFESDPGLGRQAARREGLGRPRGVQASLDRYFLRAGAHLPAGASEPGWAGPQWPSQ